jgi:hypothetical protein
VPLACQQSKTVKEIERMKNDEALNKALNAAITTRFLRTLLATNCLST